ncbi:DUF551 domain-containing protein [uncultured Acinetobacter sp.]|uniref:DUF551 domain-containing protein n=1 Tax=uncultured Acinetobacter sp. TaxID=165433 RepID=UPI0025D4EF05|nr:DUF551 domain-containing protein [uncultured Acinetobacter sp.]
MDILKEREVFETYMAERFKDLIDRRICINSDGDYMAWDMQVAWQVWQAAKAQAVPEWISTSERMPNEGEEVLVHNLGKVRQVTRDSSWAGGFKERNCYGWQAAYSQSHWMPKSIKLPEDYNFYYENDAKQKTIIQAQENE